MALYDGFFDATYNEETQEYDRNYGSDEFTNYFGNVIGSGVCIHNNPNSFKAEYENGTLYLRPGYLFINGYWLANKAVDSETNYKGYTVTLPTNMTGSMAVVAHLNLGQRLIEIQVQPVSQAYQDSLVLAIITTTTAEDTRHNTDICGVLETAGELSRKVEWAVNYIDTEIESKLQQVEADIAAQELKLDAKIAEVQAVADSIVPPPIGTIKFSASEDVGPEWLQCNGYFISESQYPELVAVLGKLTPSADKFQLVSSGEIGPQITNGVLYGGRLWIYSYSTKKLYGVDVVGTAAIKEIAVTSESDYFLNFIPQSSTNPLCLSIVPHKVGQGAKIFLAQWISSIRDKDEPFNGFLLFQSEFTGSEETISFEQPFNTISDNYFNAGQKSIFVPYIDSIVENGTEKYICPLSALFSGNSGYTSTFFLFENGTCTLKSYTSRKYNENVQLSGLNHKNNGECVYVLSEHFSSNDYKYSISSTPNQQFASQERYGNAIFYAQSNTSLNIVGSNYVISGFTVKNFPCFSFSKDDSHVASHNINLPSSARVFLDGGAYLWGKDIYMIFVGTGIIFSRTLEEGSFGYLDTTSVLGTITQYGYLDYSQDEGTLYLLGQDTTNTVKVAKMELNTLFDYANDGAWLPMIASDGVPAYIKAKEVET